MQTAGMNKKIGNYIHMRIRNLYLYFYPWAEFIIRPLWNTLDKKTEFNEIFNKYIYDNNLLLR